jgi:hypothetical protein
MQQAAMDERGEKKRDTYSIVHEILGRELVGRLHLGLDLEAHV